ncbi:hypothetical protein D3C87_1609550 [compost metagenome]
MADEREVVLHQSADRITNALGQHRFHQFDVQRASQRLNVRNIAQDAAAVRPQQAYAAVAARHGIIAGDVTFHRPANPALPRVEVDECLTRKVPDVHATGTHVGFHGRGTVIGPVENFVVPGAVVLRNQPRHVTAGSHQPGLGICR